MIHFLQQNVILRLRLLLFVLVDCRLSCLCFCFAVETVSSFVFSNNICCNMSRVRFSCVSCPLESRQCCRFANCTFSPPTVFNITRGLFFAWPASPGAWKTFVKHKKQLMKETINGFSLSPFSFVNFQQEFKEKMENSICQKTDRNNWEYNWITIIINVLSTCTSST